MSIASEIKAMYWGVNPVSGQPDCNIKELSEEAASVATLIEHVPSMGVSSYRFEDGSALFIEHPEIYDDQAPMGEPA